MLQDSEEFVHVDEALEASELLTEEAVVANVLILNNSGDSDGDDGSDDVVGQVVSTLSSQEALQII